MQINITITNAFTSQVEVEFTAVTVENPDIDYMHAGYSVAYPDSFVNFVWGEEGSKSFICGMPHNMAQDEIAHREGRMTWEEYSDKWYFKK